jgi:hypothetical protein
MHEGSFGNLALSGFGFGFLVVKFEHHHTFEPRAFSKERRMTILKNETLRCTKIARRKWLLL